MKRIFAGLVVFLMLASMPLTVHPVVASSGNYEQGSEVSAIYSAMANYWLLTIKQDIEAGNPPSPDTVRNYVLYSTLARGEHLSKEELDNATNYLVTVFSAEAAKRKDYREMISKLSGKEFPDMSYDEFMELLARVLPKIYQPEQDYIKNYCGYAIKDKYTNDLIDVAVYPWPGMLEVTLVFNDEDNEFPIIYDDDARPGIYGNYTDIEHFFITFDSNALNGNPTKIKFQDIYYNPDSLFGYCGHGHNTETVPYQDRVYVSSCGHAFSEKGPSDWNYVVWTPQVEYEDGVPVVYYVPDKQEVHGVKLHKIPVKIGTYDDMDVRYRKKNFKWEDVKLVNVTLDNTLDDYNSFDEYFKDNSHWDFQAFRDYLTILQPGKPIESRFYVWAKSTPYFPLLSGEIKITIPDWSISKSTGDKQWYTVNLNPIDWRHFQNAKYILDLDINNIPQTKLGIHTMYISLSNSDKTYKTTKTFCLQASPEIRYPTSNTPVWVGSINNPNKFTIRLFLGCEWTTAGDLVKEIKIGKKPAKFKYVTTNFLGEAYILVYPPKQDAPGKYDLTVKLFDGKEVTQHDTVKYSDESSRKNVDVVFIIDNSGSMSWNDPNGLRGEAVKMLIDQLDIGDAVSIISFEGSANVLVPMTVIDSKSTKEQLISQVRTWAGDGTSLSAGLNAGYQQLLNSPSGNPEKVAIMLTDGVGSYNNEAELYKQQGWPVYTVGLGDDINPQLLSKIATETGGIYLHADKPEDIMKIYNIIKGKVKRQQTLSSTSVQLSPGQSVLRSAYVDPTVSSTTFSVSWPGSDVNLTLISPDGTIITPETAQADTNITYTKGNTYVIYEIKNPLPGEWKMNITAVDVPETGEEVTAMVLADTNLTIDLFTEKSTYKLEEPVRLVGVLTLNGEPVEGIVNATVIKPDGSVEYLQLLDDDNDGVYETYYVPKEAGTYTITLQASGKVNGVPFTRQEAFSVHVSSEQPQVGFKASIDKFSISTVSGKTLSLDFTINSTVQDIVRIGLTSLSNGTNTIAANYTVSSGVLEMVPDENVPIHFDLTVPFDAEPGNYTGEIVIQGTSSVLTIPIELEVKPRLQYSPEDVELYSTDVGVDSIEVYEISEDTLKQITGDVPEVKNLRAFIITSAGFGNFKLRFSNISEVENVKVFKYDIESKKWKQTNFEVGSVIIPLSVNGFNIELVVIGGAKTPTKETSSHTNIITLSHLWTTWFFKYHDEFVGLYKNATTLGIDNETLSEALELHQNATNIIIDAWWGRDLPSIRNILWTTRTILPIPRFWEIRKAYLMEKEAVELLKQALTKYQS